MHIVALGLFLPEADHCWHAGGHIWLTFREHVIPKSCSLNRARDNTRKDQNFLLIWLTAISACVQSKIATNWLQVLNHWSLQQASLILVANGRVFYHDE